MNAGKRTDILIVGHYVHDTLISGNGECHETLGGPPAYISSILDCLDVNYSVIAKVGSDFKYFQEVRHAPIILSDSHTTTFVNDYSQGGRKQIVHAICDPILPGDITGRARVGLACGVLNEILPETMLRLRETCEILVADVQGFIRVRHEDNSVGRLNLEDTPYAGLPKRVDYLKVSLDEARFVEIETMREYAQILLTAGKHGCTVYERDKSFSLPGIPAPVKDTTGAGDCFMAGFAYGLSKGLDCHHAARIANCCGAQAVRDVGIPRLTEKALQSAIDEALHDYSGLRRPMPSG